MDREQLQAFQEDGFLIIPGLVEEKTIEKVFREIKEMIDIVFASKNIHPLSAMTVNEKYMLLKKELPLLKARIYDMSKLLGSVLSLATSPGIMENVLSLSKGPVLIDNPQVRIDDKDNDRLLPFHQEGVGQISLECITVWLPLVDVRAENGAMRYIPGSHRAGYVKHRFYPEMNNYHGIREELVDKSKAVYAEMKKGDALIFDPRLYHASTPNNTDEVRWTFIARYNDITAARYLRSEEATLRIEQQEG